MTASETTGTLEDGIGMLAHRGGRAAWSAQKPRAESGSGAGTAAAATATPGKTRVVAHKHRCRANIDGGRSTIIGGGTPSGHQCVHRHNLSVKRCPCSHAPQETQRHHRMTLMQLHHQLPQLRHQLQHQLALRLQSSAKVALYTPMKRGAMAIIAHKVGLGSTIRQNANKVFTVKLAHQLGRHTKNANGMGVQVNALKETIAQQRREK